MIAQLLIDAADFDAAAGSGSGEREAADRLTEAVGTAADSAGDLGASLARQVKARATARFLLTNRDIPPGLTSSLADADGGAADHAGAFRQRADRLAAAGKELKSLSANATATGAYLRAFAGLCGVAAHLMKCAAAELEADTD